jgi:hypothetical protein
MKGVAGFRRAGGISIAAFVAALVGPPQQAAVAAKRGILASAPNGGRRRTVAQDKREAIKRRNRARHRAACR